MGTLAPAPRPRSVESEEVAPIVGDVPPVIGAGCSLRVWFPKGGQWRPGGRDDMIISFYAGGMMIWGISSIIWRARSAWTCPTR